MSTKELTYRFGADYSALLRGQDRALAGWQKERRAIQDLQAQQREHRMAMADMGQGMVSFGVVAAAGFALAGKAAIDWESAFTGVRKTVDGSDAEIAALERELRGLAKTLPTTHEEIAGVAEAAGQLGIKRQDIAAFTRTMIDLGNTTNLTAEDASTALAKISNIMGTSAGDVDRLGSALVALGNDGASTEADIIAMALRIAGAGKVIGLTEAQVLAFASSLSSVGIEAEAGGSAISRVMVTIDRAVRDGGASLDAFAKVAGVSAAEFSTAYDRDASAAIASFITGLGNMQKAGGNVFKTLEQLGFGEIVVRDALLRTAGASDLLTKSLNVGNQAWDENTALTEEAAKRYETSASRLKISGNQIKDAMIDVGAAIAPVVVTAADGVANLVAAFQHLPGPLQDVVLYAGAVATGVALLGGAALIAVPKVIAFRETMRSLQATGGATVGALGRFGLFMSGPWGAGITAGVALLGLFGVATGGAARRQDELRAAGREVADMIREQNGAIDENVRRAAFKKAEEEGLIKTAKSLRLESREVVDAMLGQGDAYDRLTALAREQISANTPLVTTEKELVNSMLARKFNAEAFLEVLTVLNGEMGQGADQNRDYLGATVETTAAQKEAASAYGFTAEQVDGAAESLRKFIDEMDRANGAALSARDAHRQYLEQIDSMGAVLKENGRTLDNNTEKGRANNQALDDLAKAASDYATALAEEASANGDAVAGNIAMRAALEASRPILLEQAKAFGMGQDEAAAYVDKVLRLGDVFDGVLTPGALKAQAELQGVTNKLNALPPDKKVNVGVLSAEAMAKLGELGYTVERLPDGTVNVTANLADAYANLEAFLRQRRNLTVSVTYQGTVPGGFQSAPGRSGLAYGGIVSFYGHGGVNENHAPQIVNARPGHVRVWAEPETGRESYIPWATDRRAGATDVLRSTAAGFGYDLAPRSQSAMAVRATSSYSSRTVDAASHFHGPVYFTENYEQWQRGQDQRRAHALFAQGLAG